MPYQRYLEPPALDTGFLRCLAWFSLFGCAAFTASILIADVVVPDHDWIADTISDLGAGKYEYIVDIGIYLFSAALIATALAAAHLHVGGWRWSAGIVGFGVLALLVFLIGARNEYGDTDKDGTVIHIYLVYALGVLMVLVPASMAEGAGRIGRGYGAALIVLSVLWLVSAPVFFFLPTDVDGLYERYLGLIAMATVGILSWMFIRYARAVG